MRRWNDDSYFAPVVGLDTCDCWSCGWSMAAHVLVFHKGDSVLIANFLRWLGFRKEPKILFVHADSEGIITTELRSLEYLQGVSR